MSLPGVTQLRSLKTKLGRRLYPLATTSRSLLQAHRVRLWTESHRLELAHALWRRYSAVAQDNSVREQYRHNEAQVFSQNGEDGLILYILSQIGATNRTIVEYGAGGKTSNALNLVLNFGWKGILIDGSEDELVTLRRRVDLSGADLNLITSWITAESINEVLRSSGVPSDVDVMSIDLDGNDYWIWKAIETTAPRLMIVEYNASLGPHVRRTVPYEPSFVSRDYHHLGWYHGASLEALVSLAAQKGYRLVCCDSAGVNAFFVRNDLGREQLPETTAPRAFYPHAGRLKSADLEAQMREISGHPWLEV
jgi:hypothetical protein